jgi:hypothetical protein
MNCPHCRLKLAYVNVYSKCVQACQIDSEGHVVDWGSVDEVLDTAEIECPNCQASVRDIVVE